MPPRFGARSAAPTRDNSAVVGCCRLPTALAIPGQRARHYARRRTALLGRSDVGLAAYAPPVTTDRPTEGHAFLSYVREDTAEVDALQQTLEAAGIRVWRDTQDLWPGEDWRAKIRQAITDDALVFLACFSSRGVSKPKSYQNEELVLAVDEIRRRRPDEPWLIPVRLDECDISDRDLGGGRTLSSLQRVDLYGDQAGRGVARLVATVLRLLGSDGSGTSVLPLSVGSTDRLKAMLPLPERDIALDDLVTAEAERAADAFADTTLFPVSLTTSSGDGVRLVADQAHRYLGTAQPLAELLATGCALSQRRHDPVWRRAVETVGRTVNRELSGLSVLLELRHLALLPVLYAAGLGAVSRQNWPALLAVSTQAQVRNRNGVKVPAVSLGHVWLPFQSAEIAASVVAMEVAAGAPLADDEVAALRTGRRGKRHTPVSDTLHDTLRTALRTLLRDDADYDDAFDETEILLAVLAGASATEAGARGEYQHGAWTGAFTWRRGYEQDYEEKVWRARRGPLLDAGAFGGDPAAADTAFAGFAEQAAKARRHRF